MNHCLLEVEVKSAPTVRYTQDNKTPIAVMEVNFAGLRPDDQPSQLKVIGWGNMAQDVQQNISIGQRLVIEGRLRMSTVSRDDGTKEKIAEFTLSRFHNLSSTVNSQENQKNQSPANSLNTNEGQLNQQEANWNSAPLIPDTDDIPF